MNNDIVKDLDDLIGVEKYLKIIDKWYDNLNEKVFIFINIRKYRYR